MHSQSSSNTKTTGAVKLGHHLILISELVVCQETWWPWQNWEHFKSAFCNFLNKSKSCITFQNLGIFCELRVFMDKRSLVPKKMTHVGYLLKQQLTKNDGWKAKSSELLWNIISFKWKNKRKREKEQKKLTVPSHWARCKIAVTVHHLFRKMAVLDLST